MERPMPVAVCGLASYIKNGRGRWLFSLGGLKARCVCCSKAASREGSGLTRQACGELHRMIAVGEVTKAPRLGLSCARKNEVEAQHVAQRLRTQRPVMLVVISSFFGRSGTAIRSVSRIWSSDTGTVRAGKASATSWPATAQALAVPPYKAKNVLPEQESAWVDAVSTAADQSEARRLRACERVLAPGP